ncbi:DUF1800 domain-containing protein [Tuwongella immobilis]|uniref:DUF1800 domain-containing protein n=1 Tax=Tuwongella immobilis TaxID=692036 RepID=A0A6C2YUA6_9BACT|nr:DUF1800 domain-containing protein [Tuwongella immobilis]VIP04937.1 Uncharacterized protein OS=Singulisphaera acidiphila (strain ATCC BAA-1392 / DSM 18658 / VKM B-2454 / MOB10) GN=Sinac_7507 PE=4 SV=1: DUF1800 [Tuwongella immobilis]VTS07232.1 Uncharacterized protein OS=Singulisphaera acidiphila (strain ATCC BAA-1392 / DSM 18658 / VKM B-2454 / MOB10) GN=Sinac_7507 PE=4 SV=1: DUF1800 [Tuwongella immobilis]
MANRLDIRTAWEAYRPSASNPWDLRKAGHLYRRAAFGGTWNELQSALSDGPEKTIERLLDGGPDTAKFESSTLDLSKPIRQGADPQLAAAWWLYRMLYTPHPLAEKMTLFWHNHFATSQAKVQSLRHMLGQYDLLHRHALGSFGPMLQAISKDPAMLIWLDTVDSKVGKPNENYARELMELFSLGIGNYTEKDIREAAKAFTGWGVANNAYAFVAADHDNTVKNVLGKSGNFNGEDIVEICLDQPACARFLVTKLYRYFINESAPIPPGLLEPLAEQFRRSKYDIRQLVGTMLRSNCFFAAENYRARIKSPVDFALGILRGLEGRVGTTGLADAIESLGQVLFQPPSVKGWDGGTTWLNGQTLLFRQNLALAMTSTEDTRFGRRCDPSQLVRKHAKSSDTEIVDFLLDLFLQGDVPPESRQQLLGYLANATKQKPPVYWTQDDVASHRIRAVCHLVLALPVFQLD